MTPISRNVSASNKNLALRKEADPPPVRWASLTQPTMIYNSWQHLRCEDGRASWRQPWFDAKSNRSRRPSVLIFELILFDTEYLPHGRHLVNNLKAATEPVFRSNCGSIWLSFRHMSTGRTLDGRRTDVDTHHISGLQASHPPYSPAVCNFDVSYSRIDMRPWCGTFAARCYT